VGARLARSLNLPDEAPTTDNDDVLVAVFSDLSSVPAPGGVGVEHALCVYPVLVVRRMFTKTIQKCFKGVGNTGPDHIVVPQPCIGTVSHVRFLTRWTPLLLSQFRPSVCCLSVRHTSWSTAKRLKMSHNVSMLDDCCGTECDVILS